MKISIFGTGYVGLVTGACLAELGNDVVCYDINERKIRLLKGGKIPIHEPELEGPCREEYRREKAQFSRWIRKKPCGKEKPFSLRSGLLKRRMEGRIFRMWKMPRGLSGKSFQICCCGHQEHRSCRHGQRIEKFIKEHCGEDFDVVSNPEFLRQGSAVFDFMNPERIIIGANSGKPQRR